MPGVLLLGAGGFIGRAVLRELRDGGHRVICVDRHPPAAGHAASEEWRDADLLAAPPDELAALLRGEAAAVINCAGVTAGDAELQVRANALLPARLLTALAGSGRRLVHLGSAAEYGAAPAGTSLDEEAPARPVSDYGVAKLAGTLLVVNAARAGSVDGVVLRLFNPLGPGMPPASMPGRAAAAIREARDAGRDAIRMGALDARRDFVDVRDVAAAVVAAALAPALPEPLLNVASGAAVQVREVVRAIADAAGWAGRIEEDPALGSERSTGVTWQRASIERIGSALGWSPRHDLAAAAASVFEE
ncbi:MAG TPA: NAD(P)-dependent oxidoreductase [Candidatus Limnocylindria bacterium]|nr:NAD(P)-dependent oxidoreductase [Candidatus Limnocylindria bacterium]